MTHYRNLLATSRGFKQANVEVYRLALERARTVLGRIDAVLVRRR